MVLSVILTDTFPFLSTLASTLISTCVAFAAQLTQPMIFVFSTLVKGFNLLTAVFLLLTAAVAIRRNIEKTSILLYADIVYACAFVWAYLFPYYEPILGGRFQDWGSLSLIIASGFSLGY